MDSQQPPVVGTGRDFGYEYTFGGRIMLSAIIVLAVVVIFMSALHLYARWYLLRLRRRRHRHGVILYVDNNQQPVNHGLDREILNSLPFYPFCSKTADPSSLVDCSVCLAEFQDKEVVRSLPKCGHSFHIQCIDMWFYSHFTCPLCRSPVQIEEPQPPEAELPVLTVMVEHEAGIGTSVQQPSSSDSETHHRGDATSSPGRRKVVGEAPLGLTIDIAPQTQMEIEPQSPGSRFLHFKRLRSINKRSSPVSTCAPPSIEVDLEAGRVPQTPR